MFGGFSPTAEAVIQQQIDSGYARFIGLVAEARHKTPAEIDRIAQGRIWDGGTARQLGLVDEFGGIDAALAWAAKAAGAKSWHAVYLGADADPFGALLDQLADSESEAESAHVIGGQRSASDFAALAAQRQGALAERLLGDLSRLLGGAGAQVYCLECAGLTPPAEPAKTTAATTWLALLSRIAG